MAMDLDDVVVDLVVVAAATLPSPPPNTLIDTSLENVLQTDVLVDDAEDATTDNAIPRMVDAGQAMLDPARHRRNWIKRWKIIGVGMMPLPRQPLRNPNKRWLSLPLLKPRLHQLPLRR